MLWALNPSSGSGLFFVVSLALIIALDIDILGQLGLAVPVCHSELGRLRQEDQKFKASLDNLVKPVSKAKQRKAGGVAQCGTRRLSMHWALGWKELREGP